MMKIQIVNPTQIVNIACPSCGLKGTIHSEKLPGKRFPVSCKQCNETFLVIVDRRKFFRKETSIPIKYELLEPELPAQGTKRGIIVDISMAGLGIESKIYEFSPEFHKEGNLFNLSFSLPKSSTSLKVRGRVVSIDQEELSTAFRIGIKFHALDSLSQSEIGFFLMP